MCIVWLYTITSTNTRNPTNTSPICIVWLYTITSTRNPTNTSPICIVWLYMITSTRNPTNTVTNVYCMTLHDNKYKHKKSYKYVTNMYCMTLHDNKYKRKKSYKYVTNMYCMTLHDNKHKHRDKQIIRNYRRWNNSMTSMLLVGLFETKRNLIGNKIKYFWFTNVYMSYKIRALNK
jgi:hypothetical protein